MKQKHKITAEEQQQLSATQTRNTTAREFATPEELLRYDARQTAVPPSVAKRLGESLEHEPPRARSFWRRFFGGLGA